MELLGIPFSVIKVDFPELTSKDAGWLSPGELARYNAVGKAETAQFAHPRQTILAADTVVALGNRILEKPVDNAEARSFLQQLSGRTHHVVTAIALAHPDNGLASLVTTTKVRFKRLTATRIHQYVEEVNVLDKAGAYSIQDKSEWLLDHLDGSLSNVIGLPLEALAELILESALSWINRRPTAFSTAD